jgi:hypothetical protein
VRNCESWLSSKRTTGLSFQDLACAVKFLHILQNDLPLSTQMDGPCVKSVECTFCSMTVLVMCFLTLLHYIAIIRKGIRKPFAAILADLPRIRIALTSHSSASGRVLLLPALFLQVLYI